MRERLHPPAGSARAVAVVLLLGGGSLLAGCRGPGDDSAMHPLASGSDPVTVWAPACQGLYDGIPAATRLTGQGLRSITLCVVDYYSHMEPGKALALNGVTPASRLVTLTAEQDPDSLRSLASLLATADAARPPDLICTAELRLGVDFTVVTDGGETLAPRIPLDECGKITVAVHKLLTELSGDERPLG
ncbi:MAG: hypothetical protein ACOYEV_10865 [Candidatus Nanopelagicales bacterium]